MSSSASIHVQYMQRALTLARRAEGRTSPNPMVGAVLVKNGQIVGEGYHHQAGQPHAEIEALHQAGQAACGASLYVTLEPCCHHGRTPPCTDALIAAGIKEVFYATEDPNPLVKRRSIEKLTALGITVQNGLCRSEAEALNQPFFKHITTGLPYVTAKFAMSLDGKIATHTGDSRWISNMASRQCVHKLRNITDCIVVGVGTILADNPELTTRVSSENIVTGSDTHHPLRLIIDSRGRIPLSAKVLNPDLPGQTILVTTTAIDPDHYSKLSQTQIDIWQLPSDDCGRVNLSALLAEIGQRGMLTVLVEGGSQLLGSFFSQNLVDRLWTFIAPCIIGGTTAPGPVGGDGISKLSEALRLPDMNVEAIDGDLWIEAVINAFTGEGDT